MRHRARGHTPKRRLRLLPDTLERRLCEILISRAGERGDNEGAEDTLLRIIDERDRAFTALALRAIRRP
jgi:hypothetical protein